MNGNEIASLVLGCSPEELKALTRCDDRILAKAIRTTLLAFEGTPDAKDILTEAVYDAKEKIKPLKDSEQRQLVADLGKKAGKFVYYIVDMKTEKRVAIPETAAKEITKMTGVEYGGGRSGREHVHEIEIIR